MNRMAVHETRMGGSREEFPDTAWSFVLSCPDRRSPQRKERLNRLLTRYWRPVYKYVRAAWKKSIEDAKDLTQEFFARILEGDIVNRYDAEKGRFRHFLKGALRNFLAKDHRDGHVLKRGGGTKTFSLDVEEINTKELLAETAQYSPEEIFDRQWARDVLQDGLTRLREDLESQGKALYFQVYEAYALYRGQRTRPTYAEIGEKLDLKVRDVENYLRFARTRLNELIVQSISDYVASREGVIEELKELF